MNHMTQIIGRALEDVEDEGYLAGRDGQPATANPYPWCPYREMWEKGRLQGIKDIDEGWGEED